MNGDPTLVGAFPSAFWFLGDLLFRWVPAVVSVVVSDVRATSSPYQNFTEPVPLSDVPRLLAETSHSTTYLGLVQGWYVFALITLLTSIPFFAVAVYCAIRVVQIRRGERRAVEAVRRTVLSEDTPKTLLRWNRVLDQSSTSSPDSWRLAILEADIMLSELLDLQGYKGETIADKMKQVDSTKFNSIDLAWEAHKIRNRVAHEGATGELTAHEARRVIGLYEKVFKEFRFIE